MLFGCLMCKCHFYWTFVINFYIETCDETISWERKNDFAIFGRFASIRSFHYQLFIAIIRFHVFLNMNQTDPLSTTSTMWHKSKHLIPNFTIKPKNQSIQSFQILISGCWDTNLPFSNLVLLLKHSQSWKLFLDPLRITDLRLYWIQSTAVG